MASTNWLSRGRCVAALLALGLASAAAPAPRPAAKPDATKTDAAVPVTRAEIVARLPHDANAFTEGLLIHNGDLYESTGREGQSTIRQRDLATGTVKRSVTLPASIFGEGIVIWRDQLLNVIWHGGVGERRALSDFRTIGKFGYTGEGWGMTQDGAHIILSDGTPQLRFLDPRRMKVVRRLTVTFKGRPVERINELEYVKGSILANVWMTPYIIRISPATGAVTELIDLTDIVDDVGIHYADAVANGIAYDAATDRLYVTGKLWPTLYQIKLTPLAAR